MPLRLLHGYASAGITRKSRVENVDYSSREQLAAEC